MTVLNPRAHFAAAREVVGLLTRHRELTWEMTRREVGDRYAGQVMGTVWAVGHPLLLMSLYVFIFGYVFPIRVGAGLEGPRSPATYILAGLVPWMAFADSMLRGALTIVSHAELVKKVVFPLEILPAKGVFASLLTQVVALVFLLAYMGIRDGSYPWTVALLPLLLVVQMLGMLGVSYALAAIGTYLRDLKDILQVLVTAGLYVTPILYFPPTLERLGPLFARALWANPFSHLVWCYQDALFFGRFQHPLSWVVVPVLSLAAFSVGYRLFRKLRTTFGNVL